MQEISMAKHPTPPSRSTDQLLHAKLMAPRLHANVIQRADLLARLDSVLTKKLMLVTAPTGFGKTTLVSMWIASRELPAAWVTLDESDNDPARFWTYLCSALRTFDASLGKTTLSALTAPQPTSMQHLLTPLINDLMRWKDSRILVLDEYQAITSDEIHAGLSFLLQHLPETLHLVLISRSEPSLPLGILRARDELADITTSDLRFDEAETGSFLDALSTGLTPETVTRLQERTDGWAAGLRLAALSLQNKEADEIERFMQTFSGSHRHISDYLIKEVFENQSKPVQDFLLKTCFLSRLTASLCDALTGTKNSASILEGLERDNLFITQLEQSGGQTWYRYNPLFAESIQHLARQRLDESAIQSLFEESSQWYEYHGLFDEAIETALAAKSFDRAIGLIEKFIEIHNLTESHTISRWLESIPQQEFLSHPAICFTYAQVILYSTDRFAPATATRIEPYLHAAESAWRAEANHASLGQLLSFRGIVVWWQGDLQKAFAYARQSLEELPEYDVLWRGNSLLIVSYEALNEGQILTAQDLILEARALLGAAQNNFGVLAAIQLLSEVFYWQGELEQAEQLNQQILVEAVGDESMLDDQGIASLQLANIAYERNELEQAEQFAARALRLGERRANELLQMQASIRLAHIYFARGDSARARELVKSLESKIKNPALLRDIQDAQALFSIRANDLSSLAWWMNIASAENPNLLNVQKEREVFTLVRLRIAQGRTNEVSELLEPWKVDSAQNGRLRSRVEALILEALAQYSNSSPSKSAEPLIEALTIGQAKGFRRLFLDEGPRMASLLQVTLPSLPNRGLSLFATTLLHSFSPAAMSLGGTTRSRLALPKGYRDDASVVEGIHVEALSQQELRVLRYLVAGLSNADIARELVVSTNTIKTQVKSIYRKLNVKSRQEAREVARELKLI